MDPSSTIEQIQALLEEPTPENISAAHDIAAGEIDSGDRRTLYTHLHQWCIHNGRWFDAQIFKPFTGTASPSATPETCFEVALRNGRIEETLALSEWLGQPLAPCQIAALIKKLPAEIEPPLTVRLLAIAAHGHLAPQFASCEVAAIAGRYWTGKLSESESAAYRLAFEPAAI